MKNGDEKQLKKRDKKYKRLMKMKALGEIEKLKNCSLEDFENKRTVFGFQIPFFVNEKKLKNVEIRCAAKKGSNLM